MKPNARLLLIAVAALSSSATAADLSRQEMTCLSSTSLAQARCCQDTSTCVAACAAKGLSTGTAITECYPPYDPAGSRSVDTCVVGKREKITNTEQSKCTGAACPSCLAADCQADAPARTAMTSALVDYYIPLIFCDDSASPDGLTGAELRCMRVTGVKTGRLARQLVKCYGKCSRRAASGAISITSCYAPPSDPATLACLQKAQDKAVPVIDSACKDAPECFMPGTNGAFWANSARSVVDGYQLGGCNQP